MDLNVTLENLVSDLYRVTDKIIFEFVYQSYHALVYDNLGLIHTLMVLFVVTVGIRGIQRGYEASDLVRPVGLMIAVYVTATNWPTFEFFIYDVFTKQPDMIVQTMVDPNGIFRPGQESISVALNKVLMAGFSAGTSIMKQASYMSPAPYIWGALVLLATFGSVLFATFLIIYSKMAMGILLFLGPLVLFMLLFNSTRSFFEKWLQQLVTYAMVPIITSGILMLVLSITNATIPDLKEGSTIAEGVAYSITPFISMQVINLFFLTQVMGKAAAISGGLSLAGVEQAWHWGKGHIRGAKGYGQSLAQNSKQVAESTYRGASSAFDTGNNLARRAATFARNRINARNQSANDR